MKHPLFSNNMEDGFSQFLLKFSISKLGLLFGIAALFIFIVASQSSDFFVFLNEHWFGGVLEVFCVVGALLTWFAAQAHSYKNKRFKLVISIFVLWPISYIYLLYIQFCVKTPNKPIKSDA